jgi:hypothetical protein
MLKNYDEEILEILHNLDDRRKQEALVYLRSLQRPKGVSGKALAASMQGLYLDEADAVEMMQLIEDACEIIDMDEGTEFDE